jgi:hypothetical protein
MSNPVMRAATILAWVLIAVTLLSGAEQFALIFAGTIEVSGGMGGSLTHGLGIVISMMQGVVAPVTLLFVIKLYADKPSASS